MAEGRQQTPKGRKAKAAQKEAKKEAPVIDFRGIKLTLPEKLPATFALRLERIDRGDDDALFAMIRLLSSVTGDEQWAQIEAKLDADGDPADELEEILGGLFDSVLDAYGIEAGEAEASDAP